MRRLLVASILALACGGTDTASPAACRAISTTLDVSGTTVVTTTYQNDETGTLRVCNVIDAGSPPMVVCSEAIFSGVQPFPATCDPCAVGHQPAGCECE